MPNKRRRRIELNAKYVREILDYDPNTGIFRWRPRATINKNKKRFDVGFFDSAEDAAAAREKEVKRLHGEFAAETRIANYSSSHD